MNRTGPGRRCEVLIVGGGPTGLFLAVLLAARGVDVRVLERRREVSAHSRAIGLHPRRWRRWPRWGSTRPRSGRGRRSTAGGLVRATAIWDRCGSGAPGLSAPMCCRCPRAGRSCCSRSVWPLSHPLPCTAVGKSRRYAPTMAAWRSPRVRTAPPFPVCGYGQASWSGPMGRAAGCVSCSRSAPRAPSIRTPISWAISPILPTARGTPPVRARRSSISSPTVWWSPSRCPTGAVAGSYTPV
ncbi:FAD-dependent monooxygenase [Brachybacterium sp. Z12]|nr:FAD-dependent monooxygenase [Brachybacterium sp. Z12]